jgi:hypothetical protein
MSEGTLVVRSTGWEEAKATPAAQQMRNGPRRENDANYSDIAVSPGNFSAPRFSVNAPCQERAPACPKRRNQAAIPDLKALRRHRAHRRALGKT